MLQKIINWFSSLWKDDLPDAIEQTFLDDYAPYVRERYGIAEPFAREEQDRDTRCRK
jgi:hypothetical protein